MSCSGFRQSAYERSGAQCAPLRCFRRVLPTAGIRFWRADAPLRPAEYDKKVKNNKKAPRRLHLRIEALAPGETRTLEAPHYSAAASVPVRVTVTPQG